MHLLFCGLRTRLSFGLHVRLNPFTSIPNMAKLAHADVEFNGGFKVQFRALVLIPVLTLEL